MQTGHRSYYAVLVFVVDERGAGGSKLAGLGELCSPRVLRNSGCLNRTRPTAAV